MMVFQSEAVRRKREEEWGQKTAKSLLAPASDWARSALPGGEARSPGASTRLRPAWCLPRQAGFSFGNKRSWLELAYRVVPTVAACTASPFLPDKPPRAGCAWRRRTMDKPTEDQIRHCSRTLGTEPPARWKERGVLEPSRTGVAGSGGSRKPRKRNPRRHLENNEGGQFGRLLQ